MTKDKFNVVSWVIVGAVALFASCACLIFAYADVMSTLQYRYEQSGWEKWPAQFILIALALVPPFYLLFRLTAVKWPLPVKLLTGAITCGLILFAMYAWTSPHIAQSILTPAFGQSLSDACKGRPVAEATVYRPGPGVHPMVVLSGNGSGIYKGFPGEWTPASRDKVELVACVGNTEKVVLETCRYEGGSTIERYGHQATVRVVAAATGQVLKEFIAHGNPPRSCGGREKGNVATLEGTDYIFEANLIGDLQPLAVGP